MTVANLMNHFVAMPAPQVEARPSGLERRRYPRVRALRPAYVRLQGRTQGMAVDLYQILDLSEYGLGVQTAGRVVLNRPLQVGLDLTPAGASIPAKAQVVWLDDQGRAGLCFEPLSQSALEAVHEWLAVSIGQASSQSAAPKKIPSLEAVPITASLSMDAGSADVARGTRSIVPDSLAELEVELNLIVQRAQAYTGASGAALALQQKQAMVCCATSGTDTPGLGFPVNETSGITGESIRLGRTLVCRDTRHDARVDRLVCEDLGICSILVMPVLVAGQTVGVLELFSPQANSFVEGDDQVLRMVLLPLLDALQPKSAGAERADGREFASPAIPEALSSSDAVADSPHALLPDRYQVAVVRGAVRPTPFYQRILFGVAVVVIAVGAGWLINSQSATLLSLWKDTKPVAASAPASPAINVTAPRPTLEVTTVEGLRLLADRGDAAAQFALGAKYANGGDVPRDDQQAAQWFTRAADSGHVGAQAILGACYWVGRGVPRDLKQAYFWSLLASAGGDEISRARLKLLASQMRRSDVLEVVQQADGWMRAHSAQTAK
jgi:GAF domain-containing protein